MNAPAPKVALFDRAALSPQRLHLISQTPEGRAELEGMRARILALRTDLEAQMRGQLAEADELLRTFDLVLNEGGGNA